MNGHHIHTPLAEGVGANLLEREKKKNPESEGSAKANAEHHRATKYY